MEDNDPQGHATLLDRLPLIRKSNLDPSSLATELYSKKLITYDVKEEVDAITTKRKKLGRIVEGVMENGDSGVFQKFVAIVRRDPAHKWLADILEGRKVTRSGAGFCMFACCFFSPIHAFAYMHARGLQKTKKSSQES